MTAGREREKKEQPHSRLHWFGISSMDSSGGKSSLKSYMSLFPVKPHMLLRLLCLRRHWKGSTCINIISSDHGLKSKPTHADTAKSACWMQAHTALWQTSQTKKNYIFPRRSKERKIWSVQFRCTNFDSQDLLLEIFKHTYLSHCAVEGTWASTSDPKHSLIRRNCHRKTPLFLYLRNCLV